MTIDRYTKAVLTVIAISLSVIAIQVTTKEAHAQSQQLRFSKSGALMVTICDPNETSGQSMGWNCANAGTTGVAVTVQR